MTMYETGNHCVGTALSSSHAGMNIKTPIEPAQSALLLSTTALLRSR